MEKRLMTTWEFIVKPSCSTPHHWHNQGPWKMDAL